MESESNCNSDPHASSQIAAATFHNLLSNVSSAPQVENFQHIIIQKRKRMLDPSVEFSLMMCSSNQNTQPQNQRTHGMYSASDVHGNVGVNGNETVTMTAPAVDGLKD